MGLSVLFVAVVVVVVVVGQTKKQFIDMQN